MTAALWSPAKVGMNYFFAANYVDIIQYFFASFFGYGPKLALLLWRGLELTDSFHQFTGISIPSLLPPYYKMSAEEDQWTIENEERVVGRLFIPVNWKQMYSPTVIMRAPGKPHWFSLRWGTPESSIIVRISSVIDSSCNGWNYLCCSYIKPQV